MSALAINGFGRIGRSAFRVWYKRFRYQLPLVAINTSGSADMATWVHLLKYDSNYGIFPDPIEIVEYRKAKEATDEFPEIGVLVIGQSRITVTAQRDPAKIPWSRYGATTVIESTGAFTTREKASAHLTGGAQKVVISAPAKGDDIPTVVLGVSNGSGTGPVQVKVAPTAADNDREIQSILDELEKMLAEGVQNPIEKKEEGSVPSPLPAEEFRTIVSNASCTTNSIAPVAAIMDEVFGIQKAALTTIHSYTDDQNLQDNSHKDLRRARSAALNIVPTSTGAATAAAKVLPQLQDKFDGLAVRVPTPTGSLSDLTFLLKRPTTVEEVNAALTKASQDPRWQGILAVTSEELVSSDIVGRSESAIVDLSLTQVIDGDLVKVIAWYDNEWGYANRLVELAAQ